MNWIAQTLEAAQSRLDLATANLANAHVPGFRPRDFAARLTPGGIVAAPVERAQTPAANATGSTASANGGLPATDSAHEMVALIEAQRDFETAQKTALAFDAVRQKEAGEIGRAAT